MYWPVNNINGDQRRHLSAWGRTLPENRTGGCCSTTLSVRFQGWNQSFIINAIVPLPSPTAAPTPCTAVHADPTFIDALPAPICADMLAQDECEIPAIRARCNFTCTGCTAAAPGAGPTCGSLQYLDVRPTPGAVGTCAQCRENCPAGLTVQFECNQTHDTGCRERSPPAPATTANADSDSGGAGAGPQTIITAVLAVLLVGLILFSILRGRNKTRRERGRLPSAVTDNPVYAGALTGGVGAPLYALINDAVAGVPGHPGTNVDGAGYVVGSDQLRRGAVPVYEEPVPIESHA